MVDAVVEEILQQDLKSLENIKSKSEDALEEIYLISLMLREMLSNMDASVLFDLQKYYPVAYEKFKCHKEENIKSSFEANLKQGVKQGVFREDINIVILSKLKMHTMEWSLDPDVFSPKEYKLFDVQIELFDHYMFGVLSEKGHELLKKYKTKYEKK